MPAVLFAFMNMTEPERLCRSLSSLVHTTSHTLLAKVDSNVEVRSPNVCSQTLVVQPAMTNAGCPAMTNTGCLEFG